MKPYDATRYLRQMKYLPDVTPLCAILIVIVSLFMITTPVFMKGPWLDLIDIKYSHYEPLDRKAVRIDQFGKYWVDYQKVEDLLAFRKLFLGMKSGIVINNKKILFAVDDDTPWGKVTDVLKEMKSAGVEEVGFLTAGDGTILDYMEMRRMYREKGLKWPESVN